MKPNSVVVRSGDIKFDKEGREILDQTPVAKAIGFEEKPSLFDRIREMVRNELSQRASAVEMESFEEADDFDIDDDPADPLTPYERVFDPPPQPELVPAVNSDQPSSPAAPAVVESPKT